jgi:hypothetical protein
MNRTPTSANSNGLRHGTSAGGSLGLCYPNPSVWSLNCSFLTVRDYLRRRAGKTNWLLAFALAIYACALPASADTLPASHAVAPDRLFSPPLLESASEFPSFRTDLVPQAGADQGGLAFGVVPSETDSLDSSADRHDNRSENGAAGVRRFLLLTILFGAALRYLTSPTFYEWAADVFDPLDGY